MHKIVYRFGRFELDSKFRELRSDGDRISIAPKSLECLLYLIEHRDRAVGRDELISAVWGRADVSDHLLGQTLLGARRVLGDTGPERTTIATVPRFGYRWLAETEQIESHVPMPASAEAEAGAAFADAVPDTHSREDVVADAPPTPRGGRSAYRWPALALVVLAAAGAWALLAMRAPAPPPAASVAQPAPAAAVDERDTYLVLPVVVANADADSAWVRLGGMDYVASRLRNEAGLRVLSSQQAMAVAGEDLSSVPRNASDVHRVRAITGASYVLMLRAARSAQAWVFEMDVYHDDGLHTYSGSGARPLEAADEASRHFLQSQGVQLQARAGMQPAFAEWLQRVDASFLKGELGAARQLIDTAPAEFRGNPELTVRDARIAFRSGRLDAAEALFRPLAEDARLDVLLRARAWMGLGSVALRRNDFAAGEGFYGKAIALLEGSGTRTLLGTAYMERASILGELRRYDAAMSDFGRARIEMERSGDTLALGVLDFNVGLVESYRNRFDEALAAMDRAIDVIARYAVSDMLATSLLGKTGVQLTLVDNAGALATTQRFLDLMPHLDNPMLVRRLASARIRALAANARLDEAQHELDGYRAGLPQARTDPQFDLLRAQIRFRRGEFAAVADSGQRVLDRIRGRADPTSEADYAPAVALFVAAAARSGDRAKAQRWADTLGEDEKASEWVLAYCRALLQAEAHGDGDFTRAFALADEAGRRDLVVLSGLEYIRRLLADGGDLDRAVGLVGRLAGLMDRDYRVALAAVAVHQARGDDLLAKTALAKARQLAGDQVAQLAF